jgi:DNA adenine methylase
MRNLSSAANLEQTSLKSSPVLKWAGGKSQLLPVLRKNYPSALKLGDIDTFIEPFVGGGAVFFDIANSFTFKQAFLLDINPDLIILYQSIKEDVEGVISELKKISDAYLADSDDARRKNFYYAIREEFNEKMAKAHADFSNKPINLKRSARTIFLNRTCFNGLWRVNSKGLFNVPKVDIKIPQLYFMKDFVQHLWL